jgi:hypothetical protein
VLGGQVRAARDHILGDISELDRDPAEQPAVAASQHQQAFDQAFAAFVGVQQVLAEPLEFGWRRRVGHGDLDQGALDRERGPQLV